MLTPRSKAKRHSEKNNVPTPQYGLIYPYKPLIGGFVCIELCLYGISNTTISGIE